MVRDGELLVHISPLVPVRRPTAHARLAESTPLAVRRHDLLGHAIAMRPDEDARGTDIPRTVLPDLQVQAAALQQPAALGDRAVHPRFQVSQGMYQLVRLAEVGRCEQRYGESLGQRVLDPVRHDLEDAVRGRKTYWGLPKVASVSSTSTLTGRAPLMRNRSRGEKSPV